MSKLNNLYKHKWSLQLLNLCYISHEKAALIQVKKQLFLSHNTSRAPQPINHTEGPFNCLART